MEHILVSQIIRRPLARHQKNGRQVPSLLNKVHVDFWEGMHPSSWKMYDSIDHVVACGFYGIYFTTSKISTRNT